MLSNKCCYVGRSGTRGRRSKMALCVEVIVYVFCIEDNKSRQSFTVKPYTTVRYTCNLMQVNHK